MRVPHKSGLTRFWRDAAYRVRQLVPGTGHRLQQGASIRPVFILGSGRSGTTLLRGILGATGTLHVPPETTVLPAVIRIFRRHRRMHWPHLVRLVLAQFEFDEAFPEFGVHLRDLFPELRALPRAQRSLAAILDGFYRFHAREQGNGSCERWGDKTPRNVFAAFEIHKVFPDAQYVCLQRDGSDTVASILAAGFHPNLESAAHAWVAYNRATLDFARARADRVVRVRYEDLVTKPRETTQEICAFLDLPFEERMLDPQAYGHALSKVSDNPHHQLLRGPITAASIGRGRARFSASELHTLRAIIGPMMADLGYDESDREETGPMPPHRDDDHTAPSPRAGRASGTRLRSSAAPRALAAGLPAGPRRQDARFTNQAS